MDNKKVTDDIGIVLLHGAGYGSWIWEKVIPQLDYPSLAIDFPGRGTKKVSNIKEVSLAAYTESVMNDLLSFKVKKYVVVAHSYSGLVALRLATQMPEKIKSLVFLTAAAPKTGESFLSLLPFPQQIILRIVLKITSGRPPESAIRQECKGLDEKTIKVVLERYVTESPHIWLDTASWLISQELPRYYIKDESDFPHDKTIANLQPQKVFDISTGHLSMLSKPKELSSLINSCT